MKLTFTVNIHMVSLFLAELPPEVIKLYGKLQEHFDSQTAISHALIVSTRTVPSYITYTTVCGKVLLSPPSVS